MWKIYRKVESVLFQIRKLKLTNVIQLTIRHSGKEPGRGRGQHRRELKPMFIKCLFCGKYSSAFFFFFTYFGSLKPQDEEGISKEMNVVQ